MPRQWTADEVLATVRAFQPACVIIAAAELDVFTALRAGPAGTGDLAERLECDARGMAVLLDALTALGLLTKRGERYEVPADVADVLAEGGPRCALGMVRHLGNCLRRWSELARVVKTGGPVERRPSIRGEHDDTESFIRGMNEISAPAAGPLVQLLGRLDFTHLLDVGGASGTWAIAFLRGKPNATATIFDLPDVIPMARKRMEREGLSNRVRFVAGDMETDELPAGADLAWVSAIVHQYSREQNRDLFSKVFRALVPGGRILIRDVVMDESRTTPATGALFAVNMLVGTEGGGTFTFGVLREDLESAGFTDVRLLRKTEGMDSVVGAVRPALGS